MNSEVMARILIRDLENKIKYLLQIRKNITIYHVDYFNLTERIVKLQNIIKELRNEFC